MNANLTPVEYAIIQMALNATINEIDKQVKNPLLPFTPAA